MLRTTPNKGFTLIELSIVLVIIGLIVGGVLGGRELVKQAELRKVLKEAEQFKTAANAFRAKYNCYI
jgi:prepilin-type N-terminal cleavage/methylation domain-containing protein